MLIERPEMPTFTIREPANGPPVFVGDCFDHPTYTAVIVEHIDLDNRCSPPERIVTYRAADRQDLEDNGYL